VKVFVASLKGHTRQERRRRRRADTAPPQVGAASACSADARCRGPAQQPLHSSPAAFAPSQGGFLGAPVAESGGCWPSYSVSSCVSTAPLRAASLPDAVLTWFAGSAEPKRPARTMDQIKDCFSCPNWLCRAWRTCEIDERRRLARRRS